LSKHETLSADIQALNTELEYYRQTHGFYPKSGKFQKDRTMIGVETNKSNRPMRPVSLQGGSSEQKKSGCKIHHAAALVERSGATG
jgi:hypothetical protein